MPPETPQYKGCLAWKIFASVSIVAPLAVITCWFSLLAVFSAMGALTGSGIPAVGAMLLALAGLAMWFLYSLSLSLWLDLRGVCIIFGLIIGLIILSIGLFNIAVDALAKTRSNNAGTMNDYSSNIGLGSIGLASWGLTLCLLCRAAFSKPVATPCYRLAQ